MPSLVFLFFTTLLFALSGGDDKKLIQAAQSGDAKALEQLWDRHKRSIQKFIGKLAPQFGIDPDELLGKIWEEYSRSIQTFKGKSQLTTWIFRIIRSVVWKEHQKKVRHEKVKAVSNGALEAEAPAPPESSLPDPEPDALQKLLLNEKQQLVRNCISRLSDDHKTVVLLHHIEGLPVEEIAQMLKVSIGTVKSRLSRARDHLKRCLAPHLENH